MHKVLEVRNISKIYKMYKQPFDRLKELIFKKSYHKEFRANNDISFQLFEKETLGIIGINGAGKSTLLKIIAGVVNPTSGQIIRHGRVTPLLELGTGFNEVLSGYDNIFLNGALLGMSTLDCSQKAQDIIDFSELGAYIDEPLMTYSSGMRMRLAFSIALFSEPNILIVDEALSVGDAHFQAKCTAALKKRKKDNMSIIYVSHDLNSLKLLCDRVLLLSQGEVICEGNPEEVINKYNFLIARMNEETDKLVQQAPRKKSSFGTFEVEIENVTLCGVFSQAQIVSSGEEATLSMELRCHKPISNLNIGFMIRDKFGQDIYGTTTQFLGEEYTLNPGKYSFTCKLSLNIGAGKYSISTALAIGENHLEHCVHWLDHACDFEVAGNIGTTYTGLCKLFPNQLELKERTHA